MSTWFLESELSLVILLFHVLTIKYTIESVSGYCMDHQALRYGMDNATKMGN